MRKKSCGGCLVTSSPDITMIVVHHSASPHGRGDDAAAIHRWHQERGFDGCGYHWVITEHGALQAGRPWYWQGAHVAGHNEGSLGICLIGEGDFTGEQLHTLRELYNELRLQWPEAIWRNHRDLDSDSACPGFDAVGWLAGKAGA